MEIVQGWIGVLFDDIEQVEIVRSPRVCMSRSEALADAEALVVAHNAECEAYDDSLDGNYTVGRVDSSYCTAWPVIGGELQRGWYGSLEAA